MTSLEDAKKQMIRTPCSDCGSTEFDIDPRSYQQSCANCGLIIERQMMMTHTSTKGASGELEKTGTAIDMRKRHAHHDRNGDAPILALLTNNLQKKEDRFKQRVQFIIDALPADDDRFPQAMEQAVRIWKICFEKKLTRGYKSDHLASIILYIACRKMEPPLPFLLIDFSAILEVNVYKLAKKFNKLCNDIPLDMKSCVDPALYVSRFVNKLDFDEKHKESVTLLACKLVQQMKNDWITTGRRPSGICAASIYLASKMCSCDRTPDQIIAATNISSSTLKKRIKEFAVTETAQMTINQFMSLDKNDIKENLKNNKEKPPVVKEQELKKFKLKQKEEFMKKTQEEIEKFDKEYDAKHGINREDHQYSFNGKHGDNNKNDDGSEDSDDSDDDYDSVDDIDALMKSESSHQTVFVRATDTDDALINQSRNNKDNDNKEGDDNNKDQQSKKKRKEKQKKKKGKKKSDKREMDATTTDSTETSDNEDDDIDNKNDEYMDIDEEINQQVNNRYFSNMSAINLDTTTSSNGRNDNHNSNSNNSYSYSFSDNFKKDNKDEIMKYFEENDLSQYDDDIAVKSMILNEDEIKAKETLFHLQVPDWKKVKKDIDRRKMIKEEKEKKSKKRKLENPLSFLENKVIKRFKTCSDKIDIKAFQRLTGMTNNNSTQKSPSLSIKQDDPLESDTFEYETFESDRFESSQS